jgi:hypothetical protein
MLMIQRSAFVIIIFLSVQVQTSAQLFINDTVPSFHKLSSAEKPSDFHFGLSLGAGFTKSSFGNFYNTSVTPFFSYNLNPRLSIEAGISYVNFFNAGNQQTINNESSFVIPQRTFFFFAGANYKLTDRLTVTNLVYKNQSDYSPVMNAQALFPDSKGYAIGLHYKLTDHASIGATL